LVLSQDIKNKKSLFLALVKKPKLTNSKMTIGFSVAILAAAFSALPNVVPKSLLEENQFGVGADPIMLAFVIYVVNGLIFTPLSKNKNPIKKLGRTTLFLLLILGIAESAGTLTYTMGLQETSAVNASVLANGETVFAILVGITLFKERLGRNEILPFALICLGAIIIPVSSDIHASGMEFANFMSGDILILLSGFFYCLDTFIAKKISSSISIRRVVHMMSCGGIILTLTMMFLLEIPFDISFEQFSIISVIGFLGIGVTMLFFVMALRLIGAVRTVLIYSSTTIFSIIYSSIYLSEEITIISIASVVTVMVGLVALRNRLSD
jgi:drug/metabolite transporter (DMT)-like permease